MRKLVIVITLCVGAFLVSFGAASAQSSINVGDDRFIGGSDAVHTTEGVDDLFMSGDTIRSESDVSGSVHLAGRKLVINGAVGGDAYAAGMDIEVNGPVLALEPRISAFGVKADHGFSTTHLVRDQNKWEWLAM